MGAGGAPRPEAEWLWPVRCSARGADRCRPFSAAGARVIDARGDTVGAVGRHGARRFGEPCGALACSLQRPVGSPFDPS